MSSEVKLVRAWLLSVFVGVVLMTVVGGITRLTGSGLSIVEWKPVTGLLPPLSDEGWRRVYEDYLASPQGRIVNAWMSLDDFRSIFFWEYVHRVLGRVEFFVAFLPWVYFRLSSRFKEHVRGFWPISIWVLVILQGVLGWFMVASGLSKEPAVSHFRLAAHLSLAFALGAWTLWKFLSLEANALRLDLRRDDLRGLSGLFLAVLAIQIVYGAFMGGKRAGAMYQTFPDIGGEYLPSETFFTGQLVFDLLNSPSGIHYTHRTLAWLVLVLGVALGVRCLRGGAPLLKKRATVMLVFLGVQITLGALTILSGVAISLAVLHQLVALLLLSAAVAVHHGHVFRPARVQAE